MRQVIDVVCCGSRKDEIESTLESAGVVSSIDSEGESVCRALSGEKLQAGGSGRVRREPSDVEKNSLSRGRANFEQCPTDKRQLLT